MSDAHSSQLGHPAPATTAVSFRKGPDASKTGSGGAAASPSRAELWRQAKRRRAAEWAAFNAARPDDTYDAPEDVAALAHAAATVGDFKLKGDPGFMLPEVMGVGLGVG